MTQPRTLAPPSRPATPWPPSSAAPGALRCLGRLLAALAAALLASCSRTAPPSRTQAPPPVITLDGQLVILDDGVDPSVLRSVKARAEDVLGLLVEVRPNPVDFSLAHVEGRGQYDYSRMLRLVAPHVGGTNGRVLVLTDKDTFGKDLDWSTGIAYIGGPIALVSTHRMDPAFWGEAPDPALEVRRARKIALHELGHSFGRAEHCPRWECCLHGADSLEEIDRAGDDYCKECRTLVAAALARIADDRESP